ncbi:DUF7133 domain-containing protein [Candidatus Laterigemmans baculatus]|uniref:DUF7133 domain-containing protein n=1 Tax=Candidatus Laterigemmans baculatus TaxID=2770505 RepID=UPI0013D8EBA7|nr:c-type cytochrome [Candidatus Laterigemmans baculatus]
MNCVMKCLVACVWLGGVACLGFGFIECRTVAAEDATPISFIVVQKGFEVELLRSAQEGEDSWISMTFDDRGRILLGLDSKGVARVEIDKEGETTFERVEETFKHCRGVLYAHDSLYVSATNDGGLYRLRDTDGDDQFDDVQLLKSFDYRSRYGHGANQLVLGPDQMIYMAVGNDVTFPEGASPNSPYRDPQNDWLVPNPHDAGEDDRVGYILRFDPNGESWEIIAGGLRNQVDVAFNPHGEMFTYDADMEWDAGLPWYRPNRLIHVVSAGEYGWRWGTGKWPAYYADSLPSMLDTGLASPTGMEFGTTSRFPRSHRDSLFMADWQNGRILQVRMTPEGASYQAEYEVFVEGGPLNVCDLRFGPDGNLYFITGGRGSHSGLYRVRYRGSEAADGSKAELADASSSSLSAAAEARRLRHQLEAFHTGEDPGAVDFAWPHLGSSDRWIRYAARVAVERQPLEQWRERAVAEQDSLRSITALMALARAGEPSDQPALLAALGRLPLEELDRDSLLAALRVFALSFIRQGRPDAATVGAIGKRLEAMYPHASPTVNQELCELLLYLQTPQVVETTLRLLENAATQEEQIHYASMLVRPSPTEHAIAGWDRPAHVTLLQWLERAVSFPGGHLMDATIASIREDALARLSDEDRAALADLIAAIEKPSSKEPLLPPRPFVRQWTMEDLLPELGRISSGRSYASARAALAAASCLRCHRLGDEGGRIGPDLTTVARRFDDAALLESIIEPSRVIDPKYRHTAYLLDSGQIVQGRPAGVNAKQLKIEIDPLSGESVSINRAAVEASRPSEISPMPTGLVDTLTAEEILDLLAYLRAEGKQHAANFQ